MLKHEVLLENPGEFSFGTSNRGFDVFEYWRKWPVLRFVPWINGGAWSANQIVLDIVHVIPAALNAWLAGPRNLPSVEILQHGGGTP